METNITQGAANLGTALASIARFRCACRHLGWSERPAYATHIISACRMAGIDGSQLASKFALDLGGAVAL